jgi:hypothetical protein
MERALVQSRVGTTGSGLIFELLVEEGLDRYQLATNN